MDCERIAEHRFRVAQRDAVLLRFASAFWGSNSNLMGKVYTTYAYVKGRLLAELGERFAQAIYGRMGEHVNARNGLVDLETRGTAF
jgi:hypothetical protein